MCVRSQAGSVLVELRARQPAAICPNCERRSSRVHSRYRRSMADLPWEGLPVRILLHTRKFFCVEAGCSRRIFTEPLPGTAARYSRRSCRLSEALHWVTLALGGRAGARLARKLGLLAGRATLLRELRKSATRPSLHAPRVLGIDEWAWKKGHRYGTILCDLEQRRVIDLLPSRDAETVAVWLKRHPSIEVVSRDRASAFADAIAKGAPSAVQVADRWHLFDNLLRTLLRSLERHRKTVREVRDLLEPSPRAEPVENSASAEPVTGLLQRVQQNREHRLGNYEQMQALLARGSTQGQAVAALGLSLRTVQRWVAYEAFPERKHRHFPSCLDAFTHYLERRVVEGCINAAELWRELKEQGFDGKPLSVWRWIRDRFGRVRRLASGPLVKQKAPICLEHVAWLMLKVNPRRCQFLKVLYRASPEMKSMGQAARRLFEILRNRRAAAWPEWLDQARNSPLAAFARHLRRDKDAIAAALSLPWSNGMVEGQVHRLKLIKRQMYGRASFDLLKLRVLHSA